MMIRTLRRTWANAPTVPAMAAAIGTATIRSQSRKLDGARFGFDLRIGLTDDEPCRDSERGPMKTSKALDAIADKVLAFRPKLKSEPANMSDAFAGPIYRVFGP